MEEIFSGLSIQKPETKTDTLDMVLDAASTSLNAALTLLKLQQQCPKLCQHLSELLEQLGNRSFLHHNQQELIKRSRKLVELFQKHRGDTAQVESELMKAQRKVKHDPRPSAMKQQLHQVLETLKYDFCGRVCLKTENGECTYDFVRLDDHDEGKHSDEDSLVSSFCYGALMLIDSTLPILRSNLSHRAEAKMEAREEKESKKLLDSISQFIDQLFELFRTQLGIGKPGEETRKLLRNNVKESIEDGIDPALDECSVDFPDIMGFSVKLSMSVPAEAETPDVDMGEFEKANITFPSFSEVFSCIGK